MNCSPSRFEADERRMKLDGLIDLFLLGREKRRRTNSVESTARLVPEQAGHWIWTWA